MDRVGLASMNRRAAMIAALPPALLGAGISMEALVYNWVVTSPLTWRVYLALLPPMLVGLILGIVSLIALFKGLPTWGVSWLGSFLMGGALFVKVMAEELVEEGTIRISPTMDLILALLVLLTGLTFLILIARRGWGQAALFTVAGAIIFGLSLLQAVMAAPFTRTDVAVFALPVGLAFGLLLYLFAAGSSGLRLGVIGLVGLLNIGVVILVNSAWRERLFQNNDVTPLVPLLVLITAVLISGPIVGWLVGMRKMA